VIHRQGTMGDRNTAPDGSDDQDRGDASAVRFAAAAPANPPGPTPPGDFRSLYRSLRSEPLIIPTSPRACKLGAMADESHPNTFLFADLAGFTAMTEAMGDESAVEVVEHFCGELKRLAPDFGAEVIKAIGDAVMVRASEAEAAVRFGVQIADEVGDRHHFPTVRVGMHTGQAIERDGDWFGAAVNLAARVSAEASGREVFLTEATRAVAGDVDGVEIRDRGRRSLRNLSEPVSLYAAMRTGRRSDEGLPIDPVCRMAVDPDHSAGQLSHNGTEYHFCSLECAGRFASDPEQYVS
jgi:adenylate cyclase